MFSLYEHTCTLSLFSDFQELNNEFSYSYTYVVKEKLYIFYDFSFFVIYIYFFSSWNYSFLFFDFLILFNLLIFLHQLVSICVPVFSRHCRMSFRRVGSVFSVLHTYMIS